MKDKVSIITTYYNSEDYIVKPPTNLFKLKEMAANKYAIEFIYSAQSIKCFAFYNLIFVRIDGRRCPVKSKIALFFILVLT